jgi:hypothetical protein
MNMSVRLTDMRVRMNMTLGFRESTERMDKLTCFAGGRT